MSLAQILPRCRRLLRAAFLVLGVAGCAAERDAEPAPDVLLLSIDTLRGDHWGCTGDPAARTPQLDRVARRGTLAPEGRAPAPITLPSHTSLLTGLPPVAHGIRDNGIFRLPPDEGRTLAEAFLDGGWVTAAFVSAYPLTRPFGLDRGFLRYDSTLGPQDEDSGGMRQRPAGETVERAIDWLRGGRDDSPPADRPAFVWIHLFDPHAEYEPPAPWSTLLPADPYRGEVAYVDAEIGRVLRAWVEERPERPRIVGLVSDHGEALQDHGESTHGTLVYAATLRIPLVVAFPGGEPRLIREPTALERIPGTLLRAAGLETPLNPGAAPTLAEPATPVHGETLYPFYNFGWAGLRVREADGWRLIAGPVDRLFRMDEDPGELRDLAAAHPEIVARMRADLEQEWEARRRTAFSTTAREVAPEDLEALRALGYVGGGEAAPPVDEAFRRPDDPHDRQVVVDRLNQALTLMGRDQLDAALAMLQQVVQEDPRNRFAYQYMGQAAMEAGRLRLARDAYRAAIDLGRNPDLVHRDLATVERRLGNPDGEREVLIQALLANPESAETRNRLAGIFRADGDLAEARRLLQEAVDLRPRFTRAWANLALIDEQEGRTDAALEKWRRVVEIDDEADLGELARRRIAELGGTP